MKPREVSVSTADFGNVLYVNITLKLPGHALEHEPACPDPRNAKPLTSHDPGQRVREGSRKRMNKELQRVMEGVEFPNPPHSEVEETTTIPAPSRTYWEQITEIYKVLDQDNPARPPKAKWEEAYHFLTETWR